MNVNAGIVDNLITAITGHVDDGIGRLTHESEHADGDVVASGSFRPDDNGRDAFHWADGDISVISNADGMFLQLGDNFKSGAAPDAHIYLASSKVTDNNSFWASDAIELSRLSSGSGAQVYKLPADVNIEGLEVIIWCKAFGVYIGAGTL